MSGPRNFDLSDGTGPLRAAIDELGLDITAALGDILASIEGLSATLAVLESDYVDVDYRDEYVHYYAFTYRALPTRCHRLHFFRRQSDGTDQYLGYSVLRPIRDHPVCRTVIVPPDKLRPYVSCTTDSTVHPYGQRLRVNGFPFMEQDSLYGVCAHASIWMVALYHYLEHGTPRRLMSHIRAGAGYRQELLRSTPSEGLTERQVGAALQQIGLEPIPYSLSDVKAPNSLARIACRYLNSRMPVILTTHGHVTVLVGYGRDVDGRLFFVRSDESRGPYRRVYEDTDDLGDWRLLLVPVPGKIYLGGESAEVRARTIFRNLLRESNRSSLASGSLRLRTYVTRAGDYKVRMRQRGLHQRLRDIHRFIGTSTWIWVVELQDPRLAAASRECVIGEVAFDATSSDLAPGPLFGHLFSQAYVWLDPRQKPRGFTVSDTSPYTSATAVHDWPTAEQGPRKTKVTRRLLSRVGLRRA